MVILAPILAPSFFKFWKRYPEIFTFFYVRAEHHWKKARARWAAFGTELANTADEFVMKLKENCIIDSQIRN